ncbi:MAG: LL-diaminopimelate aminotransferase [Phycisphaerales bacterium]|nr:LL-diaminopimelate aminotransferase [Phycisphaerales bacterium]
MNQQPFKIDVSSRIQRLPPYLFGRINKMKYDKRVAGIDIIDLGMGNPTDATPECVVEKLKEAAIDPRNHRYSVSNGVAGLRREVAIKYKKKYGVDLDPETEIIATIGSKEGFSHLCLAMLGPGDTVVVGDPAFPIHIYAPAMAGANVIRVPLGNDQAFLDRIDRTIDGLYPPPKMLILNYPHNPTSMTIEPGFWEKAIEMCRRRGVMIISDFAYGEVNFDGYKAPSFLSTPGAKELGVEFTTMSKSYNMAGWRVGFCAGNAEMVKALATIKGYYDYGIFAPLQIASIIAMRECEQMPEQQSKIYQERRDEVCRGLDRLGWTYEKPRASMFVWAKINPAHYKAGEGTIDFCLRMMDEAEVALSPGRAFGEHGEGFVRIALVENEQRLRQAMRNLERALIPRQPNPKRQPVANAE